MLLVAPISLDLNQVLSGNPIQFSNSISLILFLSLLSIAPFFLISVTSFLRITIVLGMLRTAMGTQQSPPNMVIIALSLFLTIFIMSPVWKKIDNNAIQPYNKGQITQDVALKNALDPLRDFMFKQVSDKDLSLFAQFAEINIKSLKDKNNVPTYVLIPAFMISELKKAFMISFVLFLPFILIDLLVSNILLSLGMMMLSPVMISLPFKILFFVLVDGFNIIIKGLVESYTR